MNEARRKYKKKLAESTSEVRVNKNVVKNLKDLKFLFNVRNHSNVIEILVENNHKYQELKKIIENET